MNYKRMSEDEFKICINETGYKCKVEDFLEIKKYRNLLLLFLEKHGNFFEKLTDEERDDENLLWASMTETAYVFRYASQRLKDNEEFVRKCINRKGSLLSEASERLRNKREIVELALLNSPFAYNTLSEEFRDDDELFWIGAKHTTYIYAFASKRLKEDFEVLKKMCDMNMYFLLSLEEFAHKKEWIYYIYEHENFVEKDMKALNMKSLMTQVKDLYISFKREDTLIEKLKENNKEDRCVKKI